jgi:hypothetical protein
VKHQHLPPAVGLGRFDELELDFRETVETLATHQLAHQLVVLLGCGVEAVRALGVVGMAVVGARDEGDPEPG